MTSCAKGGRKVHDIVTMRDMKGRAVKGRVTSCTSQLRQGLARESWIMGLVFRKSFLYHNFDTMFTVANVSNHTKNLHCV